MSSTGPLLVADDLRVDVADVPACDGLSLRTTGSRVLVLGAPRALFEAVTGLSRVVRGSLTVRGRPASEAAALGLLAGAAMDPAVPPDWTVLEYVEWSARLAGVLGGDARGAASAALERFQLGPLAKTTLGRLVPHARRATVIAGAWATSADVIMVEDPLGGYPEEVALSFGKILADALAERPWIVFAPRVPLASPLAIAADEAIVATSSQSFAQGAPAELAAATRRFACRFGGAPDASSAVSAIEAALAERGAKLEIAGAHVMIELGAGMTTSELLAICSGAGLAVIELAPIARALSSLS